MTNKGKEAKSNDLLVFTPKVWFSNPNNKFLSNGQCDGDCDCDACPDSRTYDVNGFLIQKLLQRLPVESVQDLRMNQNVLLDHINEHTVALSSRGDRVVVLDDQVRSLLSYLHTPRTLEDLRPRFTKWSDRIFERVIVFLLATDILYSPQISHQVNTIQDESQVLTVWLHLTNECDLACQFCYISHNNQHMTTTTAQRSVDSIYRSALTHGYTRMKLKYAGGEPTRNFDTLQAAQQRAEELRDQTGIELDTVILTNGIHLTDRQIDTLLHHNIRVMVSLDGVGQYQDKQRPLANHHGSSFSLVSSTLNRLHDWGILPHISITITQHNLSGLSETVEWLLDRQLPFSFNFCRPCNSSQIQDSLASSPAKFIEGLQRAYQVIERRLPQYIFLSNLSDRADLRIPHVRTCGVGHNYLVIDCHGNISKCQMSINNPVTTINEDDPLAVVRTDTQGIQNLPVDQKECWECFWRYRCTGGCPRLTFQHTGRYDAKSPLCEVYQAILPEIARLEALRLLKYEEPWDFRFPLN